MAGTIILNFIGIFVIFGSIVFLSFAGTKFFGLKAGKMMRGKNINVIETVNLGLDKQLHLVKIGEKFILLSSSGKIIQMLTEIESSDFGEIKAQTVDETFAIDFKSMFDKYMGLFQKGNKKKVTSRNRETMNNANNVNARNTMNTKGQLQKKSTGNSLDRIREINNKLKKPLDYSGDDSIYENTKDKNERD